MVRQDGSAVVLQIVHLVSFGLTCPFLQEGQPNYSFTATNEQRKISDHVSCKSKNLIYLTQCNKCKCQYIGETTPQTSTKWTIGDLENTADRHSNPTWTHTQQFFVATINLGRANLTPLDSKKTNCDSWSKIFFKGRKCSRRNIKKITQHWRFQLLLIRQNLWLTNKVLLPEYSVTYAHCSKHY